MSVYNSLANKYVRVGSRVCAQLAEVYGCYLATDRTGFVKTGRMGPRGFEISRTNPTDPTLDCSDIKTNPRRFDFCQSGSS